jgi:small redox-active disulfide protein 2
MEIRVLGPGCPNCRQLEELAKRAVKELGIDARVEKATDFKETMKYTMSAPALMINGKLRHSGKTLPDLEKVEELLRQEKA